MGYSVTLSILFYLLTCTWALRCDNMTDSCNSTHIEVKSQCDRVIAMSELCSQLGCNPNATCNMQCTGSSAAPTNAKRCSQSCSGRECPVNMTCDVSNNCIQNCKEFCDLSLMKCSNSASCTQVCNRGCKKMQCTSAKCTQECDGGDCVMECTAKVTECVQKCQKAPCTMICDAKKCEQSCSEGRRCTVVKNGEPVILPTKMSSTTAEAKVMATESSPSSRGYTVSASKILIWSMLLLKLAAKTSCLSC